ncbi:AzlD domain-containing protein [Salinarchaeum sp. IM2453]|uniref:AzlD family protein n=1 Tax=Salinarchaeum sp. IM2453 TaxID=2862870 RepID=UPI001C835D8C|nr:AzlD domain-containing protein [Salinarchaeum sp. IM2453]QZA88102.1 AzlD domain-containing protein [Salinarchaeum sp. IM2453]
MIDSSALTVDPYILSIIAGMAIVTYITKAGGLWLLSRFDVSDRVEAGLSVLPGAIVIAILGPELADGGPPEWAAAGVVLLVMVKTENILLALIAGLGAVLLFRTLF